ncbi:MAG: PTS ascorbate transporter subunit IIC [Bacillota bacterium]
MKIIIDVLSSPAILVGLIALIGLVLQKKPLSDVLKGTIKTIMGFMVLSAGAALAVTTLTSFGIMFQQGFGIQGVVPNNEAIVALSLKQLGSSTALIMAGAMVFNIILARLTPLKYIFLTGHHTLYMACMLAALMTAVGIGGWKLVVGGSVVLGFFMALMPALAQPIMRRITGTDDVAFGHFGTVGYLVAAGIGALFGNKGKSTEDIKFPQGMAFLRDTSVAIALVMAILFVIVAVACGQAFVESTLSGGQNFILYSLLQAIGFAGGVFIILAGVRLILAEIVPAFTGIATRLVPNAKPALDCPVVYPYAPNAVLIGFLSSFAGGILGMGILLWINSRGIAVPIILPGVVPHFFCGATAGVFGNATGGIKGSIFGALAHGLLITFLPVLLMPLLGTLGFANTTYSDSDFCVIGILFGNFLHFVF